MTPGTMTVSELIEHLKTLPPDMPVWMRCVWDSDCYTAVTASVVRVGDVADIETGEETPAAIIGDDLE